MLIRNAPRIVLMADAFAGEWTGDVVVQSSDQAIGMSVWKGKVLVSRRQGIQGEINRRLLIHEMLV